MIKNRITKWNIVLTVLLSLMFFNLARIFDFNIWQSVYLAIQFSNMCLLNARLTNLQEDLQKRKE